MDLDWPGVSADPTVLPASSRTWMLPTLVVNETRRKTRGPPGSRSGGGKKALIVEADEFAYTKGGILVSDFVTPAYFGLGGPASRFDMCAKLTSACPSMLSGGYLEFLRAGQWSQITARLADGSRSYRSQRSGRTAYRLAQRARA